MKSSLEPNSYLYERCRNLLIIQCLTILLNHLQTAAFRTLTTQHGGNIPSLGCAPHRAGGQYATTCYVSRFWQKFFDPSFRRKLM